MENINQELKNNLKQIAENLTQIKLKSEIKSKPQIYVKDSDHCAHILNHIYDLNELEKEIRESVIAVFLNRANKLIGWQLISTGGVSGASVDMKILFQGALLCSASSIIFCHNHPSGNMNPSESDEKLTEKVKLATKLLDMTLLDHIILSGIDQNYFSFADNGRL
jgi:DNA repair protein RadC